MNKNEYKNSMREICEFNSIETFWQNFEFIPKPSIILTGSNQNKVLVQGRPLGNIINVCNVLVYTDTVSCVYSEGFAIFKKGIKPEWEDSSNKHGCNLYT